MWTARRPPDPALETRQRAWELAQALATARVLQARLELLGDHQDDVAAIHALRDRLAADLGAEP